MSSLSTNHIIWRCSIKGTLTAESPLIIGSGRDEIADVQCVRDAAGAFYIPGSSLAGKLRALAEAGGAFFGFQLPPFGANKDSGTQSQIVVRDAPLTGRSGTATVRDSVRLRDDIKVAAATGKFDHETIDAGQTFAFGLEAVVRENNAADIRAMNDLLEALMATMAGGEFTIGAKTNRGYGKLKLTAAQRAVFDFSGEDAAARKDEALRWLGWRKDGCPDAYYAPVALADLTPLDSPYHTVTAEFDLPGSLLIRSYTADPGDADVTPVVSRGKPAIPGTSWGGVLRHALISIGRDLDAWEDEGEKPMNLLLDALFGHVEVDSSGSTHIDRMVGQPVKKNFASNVVFEESLVNGSHMLNYTRNAIDRFTGGVVDTKLFTERLAVGGTVTLVCRVRKKFYKEDGRPAEITPEACIGALLLALMDMGNGIAPVGGTTSVGRGLLKLKSLAMTGEDGNTPLCEVRGGIALPNEAAAPCIRAAMEFLKGGDAQ